MDTIFPPTAPVRVAPPLKQDLPTDPPLVIDLDGTLLRSDMLIETAVRFLRGQPVAGVVFALVRLAGWVAKGKAFLKARLAEQASFDPASLPYDDEVLAMAQQARREGREVVLATASHQIVAERIAEHLGLFDRVLATRDGLNLSGDNKRDQLVELYGKGGFDYLGNAPEDLKVWACARLAFLVHTSQRVEQQARQICRVQAVIRPTGSPLRDWLRALRLHQWAKNLLVFVPMLAAHLVGSPEAWAHSLLAFVLFGLCASSVYLSNDLLDLEDDRQHPTKRRRPFASGALPVLHGLVVAPLLMAVALVGAALLLPWAFGVSLLAYAALTAAYTLVLKRMALVDVVTLGLLYTLRIIAGAFATVAEPTFWMLAFSLFFFQSLALAKRYAELIDARSRGREDRTPGRGYVPDDLSLLASLGTTTGGLATLVLAFYIQQPLTASMYHRPWVIWFACPLLLYWISRVWLVAHRGQMHDDPIVYALTDRVSLTVGALFGLCFFLAL